uniref:Uncharacterized protein n=1 Tax=Globodera rostochiensis TaxID=31243 RepID=A0A914HB34_GLORO
MYANLRALIVIFYIARTHADEVVDVFFRTHKCAYSLRIREGTKELEELYKITDSWSIVDLKTGDSLDEKACKAGGVPGCQRVVCFEKKTGKSIFGVHACQIRGGGCASDFDAICAKKNGFIHCDTCPFWSWHIYKSCNADWVGLPSPRRGSTPIALRSTTATTLAHHTFQFDTVENSTATNGAGPAAPSITFVVVATLLLRVAFIRLEMLI